MAPPPLWGRGWLTSLKDEATERAPSKAVGSFIEATACSHAERTADTDPIEAVVTASHLPVSPRTPLPWVVRNDLKRLGAERRLT
jgi:hypothetical protein